MQGTSNQTEDFFSAKVLGHPAGLFVLFFTEMWERFSFYGMRVLLINFLTMAVIGYNPGWEWSAENAGALFGTYAGLLYLTPIVGGLVADKLIGYRWAVVIGSLIMTAGHASMALETEFSLYLGLALLVIGTGFFKPNMTSIISEMYKDVPEKKDGAYTIFYMGVNAGAFFGMMLCGYLAERIGWSWGFGLAGIFMLLGTLQFWLAKPLFGTIGEVPKRDKNEIETTVQKSKTSNETIDEIPAKKQIEAYNPFTMVDKILIFITAVIGVGYLINDPLSKIGNINLFPFKAFGLDGQYIVVIIGLLLFLYLAGSRIMRYERVTRDRMFAFIIFAFFTVFFWLSFEQGASSLVLFARDSVQRNLIGNGAIAFNIINALLTIVPLAIITWVLALLWKRTFKRIPGSNIVLAICFAGVWAVALWMINRDLNTVAYMAEYSAIETPLLDEETGEQVVDEDGNLVFNYTAVSEEMVLNGDEKIVQKKMKIAEPIDFEIGQPISMITKDNELSTYGYLNEEALDRARTNALEREIDNGIVEAKIVEIKNNEVEITVSWFSILNSFFIIAFASMFSKWWESKYNPSATGKYALGLIIMAIGFGLLAFGSYGIQEGVKVSMIWLIFAYLFHTLGELCLSPVGLSYVSKLVPARMIAFMFGMWYLAIAIGNKLAAVLGGQIENITEQYSLSFFFLIFTIVPAVAGLLILLLGPFIKKLMHGVK
ncbi:MFS transporter [Putridiphycobacter roseus]|uniref:MFS transporter n=1 Tax=Putridiphycobacter roseus TaxID=2219161 RepID=A0A2W1NH95_9FLAO|nr:peptide MFS transporter [Putridiphycobacter roseus]PZE18473.1 MFS transporter [Putridiphycobacter roseus]